MSNTPAAQNQAVQAPVTAKALFERADIKKKFDELLGGKGASSFMTAVLQIVASSDKLKKADPMSIYQSAAMAATLNLNINQNLGYAYIIPYDISFKDEKGQWQKKTVAQFQLGYKGLIQLAQRSGLFESIGVTHITDKDVMKGDRLLGYRFEFSNEPGKTVGYAAYFKLLNGFEKVVYMDMEQLKAHGLKYSQTYKNEKTRGNSKWETDFDAMASKTVLKLMLSKYAPLSVDMQTAQIADQAVINDAETLDIDYSDNIPPTMEESSAQEEHDRVASFIAKATSPIDIEALRESCTTDELKELLEAKAKTIK